MIVLTSSPEYSIDYRGKSPPTLEIPPEGAVWLTPGRIDIAFDICIYCTAARWGRGGEPSYYAHLTFYRRLSPRRQSIPLAQSLWQSVPLLLLLHLVNCSVL